MLREGMIYETDSSLSEAQSRRASTILKKYRPVAAYAARAAFDLGFRDVCSETWGAARYTSAQSVPLGYFLLLACDAAGRISIHHPNG